MGYFPTNYVEPNKVFDELGKYILADGYDLVLDLHNSQGFQMVEARNGKKYFDFFTCFASMPIGMNHPKLLEDDFINYIGRIAINKISNSDIYSDAMASFVKTFFEYAVPSEFKYSFYVEGGSLAVTNALKTAFDWKVRKNFAKGIKEEKGTKIIHFRESFHGRDGYTMSLTNTDPTKVKYFPKFDWPRVSNPKITFPLNDENLAKVIELENQSIKEIKQAFIDFPDEIAGIIIEPIQGEGGDNHFRPEFLKELRRHADENEALLIFDEVQTGVGLTGTMWAHQQLGVTPDVMSFGKKMQVCGILATDRLDEVEDHVFSASSRINSTWGGNLVDMVRATRYLEIIHEEKLVENSARLGEILKNKLHQLNQKYEFMSNIRGRGLFAAFDFDSVERRNKFTAKCFEEGLILLGCGHSAVRFRPALNLNEQELELGLNIMDKALSLI